MRKSSVGFVVFGLLVMSLLFVNIQEVNAYSASVDRTKVVEGECLTFSWSGFGDTTNIIVYKDSTLWEYANTQAAFQGEQEICTSDWEIRSDYKIRVEDKVSPSIYVYSNTFSVLTPIPDLIDFLINGGASSTTKQSVVLQFNFVGGEPTHYMISESSSFSGGLWEYYNGSNTINFSLNQEAGTKFVYFKLKNDSGASDSKWDNISYEPIKYYDVSGHARDEYNLSIGVVTIGGFPDGNIETDANGYYSVENIISTWTGTITPNKSEYTFSPSSKSFNGLSANTSQNFTAIPNISYSWYTGNYGPCNDTCGGGKKIRTVQCARSNDSQVVSDSYCGATKPESTSYDCPELGPSRLCNDMGGNIYVN